VLVLCLAVLAGCAVLADPLRVKAHTPAATPDAVVRLHELGEVTPGVSTQLTV
jgi:hypothetical protein